jgi:hypothetical protein
MLPESEPLPEPEKDLWDFHDKTSSMGLYLTASRRKGALRNKVGYLVAESPAEEQLNIHEWGNPRFVGKL